MNHYGMVLFCLASFAIAACAAAAESPYVGQEGRSIKALSQDEISGLLAGQGMGLAKAAELNGYPGPAHVLELASELKLSTEQRAATEALFASMQSKAKRLGAALVDAERQLDRSFAEQTVTGDSLAKALSKIGELQAEVRGAHLEAHLAELRILTHEQAVKYTALRGYGTQTDQPHDMPHHEHQMMHK